MLGPRPFSISPLFRPGTVTRTATRTRKDGPPPTTTTTTSPLTTTTMHHCLIFKDTAWEIEHPPACAAVWNPHSPPDVASAAVIAYANALDAYGYWQQSLGYSIAQRGMTWDIYR